MDTKLWYQSKIVWMNVTLTLIGAGTLVADALSKDTNMTAPGIIMVGVGVLGVILRIWFTNAPIATTPAEVASVKSAQANQLPVSPELSDKK